MLQHYVYYKSRISKKKCDITKENILKNKKSRNANNP